MTRHKKVTAHRKKVINRFEREQKAVRRRSEWDRDKRTRYNGMSLKFFAKARQERERVNNTKGRK